MKEVASLNSNSRLYFSGELLMDQGRFEEAVEKFDKAVELERTKFVP